MTIVNDLDKRNIDREVERELIRRRQNEAAALAREQAAKEQAERAALLEQAALRQTEARARLDEAIGATQTEAAALAPKCAEWRESIDSAIALVRSHSNPQNQLYRQYVDLAYRLGQRVGSLAGYTSEQREVLAKEQLEKLCSQINVWPAAVADLSVHAWTALGIGVLPGDLVKHMHRALSDGLRSAQ